MKYRFAVDLTRRIKGSLATNELNVDHLFAQAGLDQLEQYSPTREDPIRLSDKFSYLWKSLAAASGDPMLGFRVAPPTSISWLGVFGHLLMSSRNLKVAAESAVRYLPLMTPAMRTSIEQHADSTTVCVHLIPGKQAVPRERYDFTWNMFLATLRYVAGEPDLRPIAVEYAFAAPECAADYEAKFGCPVRFGAERNSITFSNQDLLSPIPTANDIASEGLFRMLDERLQQVTPHGLTEKVRTLLVTMIDKGGALRETVAARLAISERTLQRRLESEGTDFSTLVDEVRRELAEQYLGSDKMTMKEMSYKLGFSEPRAFHRACVRWFGQAPSKLQLTSRNTLDMRGLLFSGDSSDASASQTALN